jgi:hypothetical protein
MPRKIGVLTFHRCINYGSYWQARCLIEGLRAQGHDAELLDHHCDCVARAEARCAFQPMLPQRVRRQDMPAYARKARKFVRAIGRLPRSRTFSVHRAEAAAGYDTILVGSDEVWNLAHPWYGGKPIFYGVGLNAPRLVSYAASFGSYSCHWGIDRYWAEQLDRFHALSVRDQNSYWLVNGSTGREPDLVLDPCLQFPDAAKSEPRAEQEPYALVYGHGFPDWLATAVRRWADAAGVRLLSVGYRNAFADEQLIDAGPIEFARLMAGARAVVTNFFHGCVFALLNGKPFATAPSEYRLNKVRDLALALQAPHRIVNESTPQREYDRLLTTPPLPRVLDRLGALRQSSDRYLRAALS